MRPAAVLSLGIALVGLLIPLFPACRVRHLGGEPGPAASSSASVSLSAPASTSALASASTPAEPAASASGSGALDAGPPAEPAVVALLGVDSEPEDVEAVNAAIAASREALSAGGHGALDAVVEGMVVVESAASFVAAARTDAGEDTLLTDAAVSGPECWFAGVAALERVRNPVRAARALCGAPQSILAGDGALSWARALGLAREQPVPAASHLAAASASVAPSSDAGTPGASMPEWTPWEWLVGDPRRDGGGDGTAPDADASEPRLPVGAGAVLVRDSKGAFAGALSSAGADFGAPGRIGDVVIPGAALFVGDLGAVAISGYQGHLARSGLARAVYGQLAEHTSALDAAEWALAQVPDGVHMGIIVLDAEGFAARSTTEMAWAARVADESTSSASKPARAAGRAASKGGEP